MRKYTTRVEHRRILWVIFMAPMILGVQADWVAAENEPPLKLTLREAVLLVLRQNPQVQIAKINLALSEQDRNLARSALLPQLGTEISETAIRSKFEAFTGRPIPGFPRQVGPFQVFQAGASFSVPVFDLALWRRWQASSYAVQATEAQTQSVREQMVLLTVSQYLACMRAEADVKAVQSRVELAEALYKQAASLQEHGVGAGIDTLRANVRLQNEKQRSIVAKNQLQVSLFGLGELLNLPPQQKIVLADTVAFFETPGLNAEQSMERAFAERPEMRVLEARQRALEKQRTAIRAMQLPVIKAAGIWSYQGLSAANSIPVYQYQLRIQAPLFTGGRIKTEIAKTDLEAKRVAEKKQELRNQIALQVRTALAALEAARGEVDVANLGLKLANEEVIQARADLARAIGQIEALYAK